MQGSRLILSIFQETAMAKKILMLCGDYGEDYETMVPFKPCSPSVARACGMP
jgi:hypothetical protein